LTSGAALPLMIVVFGSITSVFGGFGSPNGAVVTPIVSVSEFDSLVSKYALDFVYIGIGVMAASFAGTLCWTLSGERISRRLRG
jgi:ATP-binding cassette subfamily B (MDR/TAP) protein 1